MMANWGNWEERLRDKWGWTRKKLRGRGDRGREQGRGSYVIEKARWDK